MFLAHVDPPQALSVPPFSGWTYARPHGASNASGDRHAIEVTPVGLDPREAVDHVRTLPHVDDDATVLALASAADTWPAP